jgi:hypothetical protein
MALPDYLEDTAKDYAKQATATYCTDDTSKFTGHNLLQEKIPYKPQAINLAQQGVGSYLELLI